MIVGFILLATSTSQPVNRVVTAWSFDTDGYRATIAELVERPTGIKDEAFARALIEASGLQPWNGKLIEFPASSGRMGVKAVHSGAGPEVTVYFVPSDTMKVGRVCRIARKKGGMTDAWMKSQDWCASHLGVPPLKRVPPIAAVNEPIHG